MAQSTSNGGRNGGGRGKYKQANKQLIDSLREACPPHKLDDLEDLVKDLKGDEEKIREKISEWWEEPIKQANEGEWEDVNKKGTIGKKKDIKQQPRGGRGDGKGRVRGGREGRGRGRGDRSFPEGGARNKPEHRSGPNKTESQNGRSHGNPPVESVRVPQGAWSKKTETDASLVEAISTPDLTEPHGEIDADPASSTTQTVTAPPPRTTPVGPAANVWATKGSAHLIRAEKPVPPPPVAHPEQRAAPQVTTSAPPVMRTMTNDPSPVFAPIQRSTPLSPAGELVPSLVVGSLIKTDHIVAPLPATPSKSEPILETVSLANAWNSVPIASEKSNPSVEAPVPPALNKAIGSGTMSAPPPVSSTIPQTTVTLPLNSVSTVTESSVAPGPPAVTASKPQEQKLSFINMGHWDADDADDANLDFEFGTFETTASTNETTIKPSDVASTPPTSSNDNSHTKAQPSAAAASPARPPPGLTIGGGGMPPMPPNAVLVHELENKLEQVSMDTTSKEQANSTSASEKAVASMQQQQVSQASHDMSVPHMTGIHPQNHYGNANQYTSAMGMGYNYNAGPAATSVNAFVGIPGPGAPVLGTPQQPPIPKPPTGGPLQQTGAGSLYGTQHAGPNSVTVSGSTVGGSSNDTAPTASTVIPPGMPNPAIPYGNIYYGQQPPFHMAHGQAGLGYNYYGAQFGGVQGFGYPQGMGQSSGYAPYHDDQAVTGTHTHSQQGSGGVYQPQPKNNSGRYGGRNSHSHHSNSNQYQQGHQYNPQQHHQGGYGGQPYGMGYHGDHFSQRAAYGGMQEHPYSMQPQQPQGGNNYAGSFQPDDQYKGKNKGNRGGGLQHFQQPQVPPQQLSGQQAFSLQGQGSADSTQQAGAGAGGWSNQHGAGWSSGTSGWQQK